MVTSAAAETPAKHVTFVRNGFTETVETRAATIDDLLIERGIVRSQEDALSADPASPLADGETVVYRPAVPVTLVVDNVVEQIRTPAVTVRDLLATQSIALRRHDTISPPPSAPLENDTLVRVTHVTAWIERVRTAIAAPVSKRFDFSLAPGKTRVIDAGRSGTKETTIAYSQPNRAFAPKRSFLASRVLRAPRARIIALGVGEMASFANVARRGVEGTARLASAAITMIATAYTANCTGCSGFTASGRPAGHGIVAVDPRLIPLGTQLYIPGYGQAFAGDTGGAIHGHRIDLGFNSHRDAMSFGRRSIVVYVLK